MLTSKMQLELINMLTFRRGGVGGIVPVGIICKVVGDIFIKVFNIVRWVLFLQCHMMNEESIFFQGLFSYRPMMLVIKNLSSLLACSFQHATPVSIINSIKQLEELPFVAAGWHASLSLLTHQHSCRVERGQCEPKNTPQLNRLGSNLDISIQSHSALSIKAAGL